MRVTAAGKNLGVLRVKIDSFEWLLLEGIFSIGLCRIDTIPGRGLGSHKVNGPPEIVGGRGKK